MTVYDGNRMLIMSVDEYIEFRNKTAPTVITTSATELCGEEE